MKKIFILILCLLTVFSLCACDDTVEIKLPELPKREEKREEKPVSAVPSSAVPSSLAESSKGAVPSSAEAEKEESSSAVKNKTAENNKKNYDSSEKEKDENGRPKFLNDDNSRFGVLGKGDFYILVDKETGVEYSTPSRSSYFGVLTPLLDKNGKPLICEGF